MEIYSWWAGLILSGIKLPEGEVLQKWIEQMEFGKKGFSRQQVQSLVLDHALSVLISARDRGNVVVRSGVLDPMPVAEPVPTEISGNVIKKKRGRPRKVVIAQ